MVSGKPGLDDGASKPSGPRIGDLGCIGRVLVVGDVGRRLAVAGGQADVGRDGVRLFVASFAAARRPAGVDAPELFAQEVALELPERLEGVVVGVALADLG